MRLKYLKSILNQQYYLLNFLYLTIPNKINFAVIQKNILNIYILPYDIKFLANFLKLNNFTKFANLSDIAVVDLVEYKKRFKICYNFLSIRYISRLFINFFVEELQFICSLKQFFYSAPWLEREVWDMYGIFFINNNDMRRILTDYGFRGFPFRKDFPLTGYIELRHDDSRGDIVYEPLELTQELRFFNFATGWEKDY